MRIKIKQYYFFLEIKKYIPVDTERIINPPINFDDGYELLSLSAFLKVSFFINNGDFI